MLNLDLIKHTRVYQEAKEEGKEEGKLEVVPKLLQRGLNLQEIAETLEVDVETLEKLHESKLKVFCQRLILQQAFYPPGI